MSTPRLQPTKAEARSRAVQILALTPADHDLHAILNDSQIDMKTLRRTCRRGMDGLPRAVRFHCWKLLLGSLESESLGWSRQVSEHVKFYSGQVSDVQYVGESLLGEQASVDKKLWGEIEMDTSRTHNGMAFFGQPALSTSLTINGRQAVHHQVMARILYVWGKLNPSIQYVQGMNELLAPIYYLACRDLCDLEAEAECFFAFNGLVGEFINFFIKGMDKEELGIHGRIALFSVMLRVIDYNLWRKIKEERLDLSTFCFRWFTLLLSQEFPIEDTIRVWDVLLSFQGQKRLMFLFHLCIAILLLKRKVIMDKDFSVFLPELHKIRGVSVKDLLHVASVTYSYYHKTDFAELDRVITEDERRSKGKTLLVSKGSKMFYMLEKTSAVLSQVRKRVDV